MVALGVVCSFIPVIIQVLKLKSHVAKLADNQLFVALSASQTSAESLPRSIAALGEQVEALQRAVVHVREALKLLSNLQVVSELRALKNSFRALIDALR